MNDNFHSFGSCPFNKTHIHTQNTHTVYVHIQYVCSVVINLKLQSVTFTSLSPSMFENMELQFLEELSSVRRVVIWCSSADESNVLR